jgi:hypothetical protein
MTAKPDPRSGLDEQGNWTPAFEGQRAPFAPGHDLGGRPPEHGAYAELALSPRAEALAARLRELGAEHLTPADEAGLAVAALSAIQLSCATGALEEVTAAIERDDVDVWLGRLESRARLSQDARRWSDTTRRWFDSLGLTPVGRAALEAAQQPRGIPAHEVAELFSAFAKATLEFVDRARRDQFLARIHAVSAPLIGELPAATEVVDVVETHVVEEEVKP